MRVYPVAVGVGVLLIVLGLPRSLAQSRANEAESSSLIAWTEMQVPVPLQTAAAQQAPDPSPGAQDSQDASPQTEPATQTFAGTIMRDMDQYVLKTADNVTYHLDDQIRAGKYDGKQVQVMGILDTNNEIIQVRDIKMAS